MRSVQQTATDGPLEVLVAVERERDRQLLAGALDEYDVSTATDAALGQFDCCVVDEQTFPALAEELLARKTAAEPVFLPVLVLANDAASAERLLADSTPDAVDDVVVVPTATAILRSRIASLLERRALSLRLDAERAEYQALVESAQDAVVVFDDDNVVRFVNRAVEPLFGYDPDVLVGTSVTDLLVEAGPGDSLVDPAAAIESESEPFETEVVTARHADGHHVPVEVSAARFDAGGEPRYTAIVRDVTEREARTAELAEERALLQGIFDASPDILLTVDADATLNRWNDRLPELTGYTDAELAAMPTEALVADGEFEDAVASLETAIRDDTSVRTEVGLLCADGERVPLEAAIGPIPDEQGAQAVVAARDITERKQRERELERNRDLLARTQAIADVGGFEVDPRTGEVFWTDQVYDIIGRPISEEPSLEETFDIFHPEDRPKLRAAVEAAVTDREPQDLELRVVRPSGEIRWIRLRGEPEVVDGEVVSLRGAIQDVTERKGREEELEQSHDLLTRTQAIADVGGWSIDPATLEVFWTDQVYEILGLPVGGEPPLEGALDVYHPDDRPTIEAAIDAALDDHERIDERLRIVRPSGEMRWVRVLGEPEVVDGEVVSLRGAIQDVTERRERERAVVESEQRFRAVFEGATDAMVIANDDGEYVAVNPAACELFGLPESELLGRTLFDFAPEEYDAPGEWEAFLNGEVITGEFPLVRPDGTRLTTQFAATPNILPGRHLSVIRDVTDDKLRERELERYEAIVETASDPVYVLDASGNVTMANEAMVQQFAGSRGDIVGASMTELIGREEARSAQREITSMLREGDDQRTVSVTLDDSTRRVRQYEVNVSILRSDGEFAGTVGVAREVTDLVQREQRLSVLDRVLRHNIRNKLNVVVGRADQLVGDDDATVRANASAIVRACEELLDLSETARRFETTLHAGEAGSEPLDLAAHLPTVVEEANASYPEATVGLNVDAASLWVDARGTLELAIEEVLENAIVHSDRSPSVEVTARDDPEAGVVELRVADNGPGLDAVDRKALERGIETPLEHMQGLGLWFVRWTVESSGGTLELEDNDPRGTVVVLRLPRADPPSG